MPNPKVPPPHNVGPSFWVEYSQHASNIRIIPFELEEIDRMAEAYGDTLDRSIAWNDNGVLRTYLLKIYRDDLICRTHRAHMLEALEQNQPPMDN